MINSRIRQVILILALIGIGAFVVVQARNLLVKRIYKGQVRDIEREMRNYKELNDVNTEMWGGDGDLKQIDSLKKRVQKLAPASDELKKSKQHLLKALEYLRLAQKESGMTIPQLQLAEDQDQNAQAIAYLDKATDEAARSTGYLKEFEKTYKELFQ